MRISEEKIKENLRFPVSVTTFDSVGSTNDEAKLRALSCGGIALYAAQRQTNGRGRRGHSFYSPKGTGLYMSVSLPVSENAADIQLMTCAAAVACCEAISELSNKRPVIKWVNDIITDGKKAAGILTELAGDEKNQPAAVIIGIGLNLTTEDFPAEFAKKAGSLGDIDPNLLCAQITNRVCGYYEALPERGFLKTYKALNICVGRDVSYEKDGTKHIARAVDIDRDGGLVVEENGERLTLRSGEISVIPL